MILEESNTAPTMRSFDLARGIQGTDVILGAQGALTLTMIDAIRSGLEMIPASLIATHEQPFTWPGDPRSYHLRVLASALLPFETAQQPRLLAAIPLAGASGSFAGIYGHSTIALGVTPFKSSTVVHEYGHHVDLAWGLSRGRGPVALFQSPEGAPIVRAYNEAFFTMPQDMYASTNELEWWAETFASQVIPGYQGSASHATSTQAFLQFAGGSIQNGAVLRRALLDIIPDLPAQNWAAPSAPSTPCITGTPHIEAWAGEAFTTTFINEVRTSPTTWSIPTGTLPAGLSLSISADTFTATISGTPTNAGRPSFTLRASNSAGTMDLPVDGWVFSRLIAPPVITTTSVSLPLYTTSSATLAATGAGPIVWSMGAAWWPIRHFDYNTNRFVPSKSFRLMPDGTMTGERMIQGDLKLAVRATNLGGWTEALIPVA